MRSFVILVLIAAAFLPLFASAQQLLYPPVYPTYKRVGFEAFTQKSIVVVAATFGVKPPEAVRLWVNGVPTARVAVAAPEELERVPGIEPTQPIAQVAIPRVFSHTGVYELELEMLWGTTVAADAYPSSAKGRVNITPVAESYGACYEPNPLQGETEGRVTQVYVVNSLEVSLDNVEVWIGGERVAKGKLISGGKNASGINTGLIETESMTEGYYANHFVAAEEGTPTVLRITAPDGTVHEATFVYAYPPTPLVAPSKRRAASHDGAPSVQQGPFFRCRSYPVF